MFLVRLAGLQWIVDKVMGQGHCLGYACINRGESSLYSVSILMRKCVLQVGF
jgi:hypothetical protein